MKLGLLCQTPDTLIDGEWPTPDEGATWTPLPTVVVSDREPRGGQPAPPRSETRLRRPPVRKAAATARTRKRAA